MMAKGETRFGALHVVGGIAAAIVLTGLCYLIWLQSPRLVDLLGVPELRILAAFSGAVLVLSLGQLLTSWRR
jgi:small neutral amino acid transporter SnatA (MarC family)